MMPRSDGDELIELLRADERTAAIPILIISGTRSGHPGADATLRKPFDPGDLVEIVYRLTGGARRWSAPAQESRIST